MYGRHNIRRYGLFGRPRESGITPEMIEAGFEAMP